MEAGASSNLGQTAQMSLSQSPSSVRWHYDSAFYRKRHGDSGFEGGEDDDDDAQHGPRRHLSEAWDIPSASEMQRRLHFRQSIREETLQHRQIHRHGGMGKGRRNIALVLWDRQYRGSRAPRRPLQDSTASPIPYPNSAAPPARTAPRSVPSMSTATYAPATKTTTPTPANANTSTHKFHRYESVTRELQMFAEYSSVTKYHSTFLKHLGGDDELGPNCQRPSSSKAVSTISIAFSPDSKTMASTHGDHTVKISSCASGHLLQTLEGHPRTPWTVKFHPIDSHILASGCLGFQVRLWDWPSATCLHMIRLEAAIISLSFHPTGKVLAIANGTQLHFWALEADLTESVPSDLLNSTKRSSVASNNNNSSSSNAITQGDNQHGQATGRRSADSHRPQQIHAGASQQPQRHRGYLTEVEQRHMLRCVHFPPNGDTIIIGGVNPDTSARRQRPTAQGAPHASFYLSLWDFDLGAALNPGETHMGLRRRAIQNRRTFVSRALLYNDGGFDVSPDGKTLCACAEYWLPNGVSNAIDLIYPNENEEYSDDEIDENDIQEFSTEGKVHKIRNTNLTATSSNSDHTDTPDGVSDSPPRTQQSTHSGQLPMYNLGWNNQTTPQTPPPNSMPQHVSLSPPSPPGRRLEGGLGSSLMPSVGHAMHNTNYISQTPGAQGTVATIPSPPTGIHNRPPNPFVLASKGGTDPSSPLGRYVPHVVTISLETGHFETQHTTNLSTNKVHLRRDRPRLGQLLEACPLDGTKATAVTCVKFSPSTNFCLIGYGVREPVLEHNGNHFHPVTALYQVTGGMTHVSTMLSGEDDVNIARFHPDPGYGFVYGTKQGRVRVLSPRPWNYYNC